MFRRRFHVFQIVSYLLDYISIAPPIHRGVYFNHLEQFGISFKNFEKIFAEDSMFFRVCHFLWSDASMFLKFRRNNDMAIWNINCGVESVNGTFEQIIWNSVKNSMFSRLCPISLITIPKILQLTDGYMLTMWDSLESVWRLLKKFRRMFRVFQIVSYQLK